MFDKIKRFFSKSKYPETIEINESELQSQMDEYQQEFDTLVSNSIMVLKPYLYEGTWVFDDAMTGLSREAFVAGVPEILEDLLAKNQIPLSEAANGFRLTFSATPFPGYQLTCKKIGVEYGGTWYVETTSGKQGWLCPALFKYFASAPAMLYARADRLQKEKQSCQ